MGKKMGIVVLDPIGCLTYKIHRAERKEVTKMSETNEALVDAVLSLRWRPISEYDAMTRKPSHVVFLVAASQRGQDMLPQIITTERRFGRRETTHFCELPKLPDV